MLDTAASMTLHRPPPPADDAVTRLGRSFVDAVVGGDFDWLEALFAPDVRFRAITPRGYVTASTGARARAIVEGWFGDTDARALVGRTIGRVGDRVMIGYRIELVEEDERRVVEQHVAATTDGTTIRDVALLCSGFRPLAMGTRAEPEEEPHADPESSPTEEQPATGERRPSRGEKRVADAPAPVAVSRLDATGLSCATLTPTISATVRGLAVGAVLEILTDDPAAEADLRSWTRLTGHELFAATPGPGPTRRFAIRRTPRPAAPADPGGTT